MVPPIIRTPQGPVPQDSVPQATSMRKLHPCNFTGSGAEYFPIWITNVAFTIVTLGLYGPWAKVRREQYFHSHTFLDGHSFEYTANPWSILKGRLLLLALFLLFTFINGVLPFLLPIFILGFLVILPWIITQSLKFRARYTSYRNIPFQFTGSYGQSFKYFIVTKILVALSFGLLIAWAKHRERKYVVTGLRYGKAVFQFNATVWDFARMYLTALVLLGVPLFLLIGVFIARVVMSTFFVVSDADATAPTQDEVNQQVMQALMQGGTITLFILGFLLVVLAQIFIPLVLRFFVARITWNNSSLARFSFIYEPSFGTYLWILISNFFLRLLTFGLASPFCAVRMHRFKVESLSLYGDAHLGGFIGDTIDRENAFGDEASDAYDLDIDLGF